MAAVLAINRLCAPGSELAVEQRWYPATALDDLLEIEEGKINDTRLYRCLDRILPHKTKLEQHLKQRYGELFGAEFDVLLYDLTSTYVEGAAENNPMMRRGYSRDHRPDCEQMVIALIVNSEGFPFSYETFDGNRADVSTMETILRMVERKYGKARRIWVFDRGIVSEENLAAIRKRGGQYLVGTPRSQMKQFEAELLKDDWTQVRPEVEVKQVAIPQGERDLHPVPHDRPQGEREGHPQPVFHAYGRGAEASAEDHRTGRLKDRNKMERRLGKIQARHPQVNDLFEVTLRDTPAGVRLVWEMKAERKAWRDLREGAYMLRTNLQADSAEETVVQVHATDRGRGFVPRAEERALDPAVVPSEGAAGQGACDGGFSRLCPVGDAQASAEAPAGHRSAAVDQRSEQRAALVADEGAGSAVHVAKR